MPSACVTVYDGTRVGRVYYAKYLDAMGCQVKRKIGRERDGWTRDLAREALDSIIRNESANPLAALVRACNGIIATQVHRHGEALPHLLVAREEIGRLYATAQAELERNPRIFDTVYVLEPEEL